MERAVGVYVGILLATIVIVLIGVLLEGEPSPQDIGKPCRDHGGVADYIPRQIGPFQAEGAFVVCRDGKVGEVQ